MVQPVVAVPGALPGPKLKFWVLPPGGITVSQVPPEGVVALLTVTAIGVPPLVTEMVWSAGAAPLTLKDNDVGLAANVGVGGAIGAAIV